MRKTDIDIILSSSFFKAACLLLGVYMMLFFAHFHTSAFNSKINFWGITFVYIMFLSFHFSFMLKSYKKLLLLRSIGINIKDYKQNEDFWFEFHSDSNPCRISLAPSHKYIIIESNYKLSDGKPDINVLYRINSDLTFETSDNSIDELLEGEFKSIKNILSKDFEALVDINFAFK